MIMNHETKKEEILKAFLFRHATKEFDPKKKISEEDFRQGQLPTASHFLIILARTIKDTKYDSEYVRNQMLNVKQIPEDIFAQILVRYKSFQEHDLHLLDSERSMFDWASKQTYLALANMMTAAAHIGIDSCPIEGFDFDRVQQVLAEENLLEDGHLAVSVMAAFGYRAQEPRPKTRRKLEEIVQWIN
jgi:nitroreductase